MKRIGRVGLAALALMAPVVALAQDQKEAASTTSTSGAAVDETKPLLDAMASIGSVIAGADKTGDTPAAAAKQAEASPAESSPAESVKKPRTARNSVILVSSGAAAGAAIGAAMGKGQKGALIGAALGGAVGLIYDRATYKNPGKI